MLSMLIVDLFTILCYTVPDDNVIEVTGAYTPKGGEFDE
jgi:hypothetical protein